MISSRGNEAIEQKRTSVATYPQKEYVAGIELGNEIRWGRGYTILRDDSVNVPRARAEQ
jgi:hypothetical protein